MTNHRYYRSTLTQKWFFWRLNHDASVSSSELCGSAIILAALAHTFIAGLGSGQSWFLNAGVLDSLTLEPLTYQEKIWKAELWLCEAKVLPVVGRKYFMAAGEAVMPSSTACCYSGWATCRTGLASVPAAFLTAFTNVCKWGGFLGKRSEESEKA